jgi:hypothetical protein
MKVKKVPMICIRLACLSLVKCKRLPAIYHIQMRERGRDLCDHKTESDFDDYFRRNDAHKGVFKSPD